MKTIRLTPPGRSAIATLLVEGDVLAVLQKCVCLSQKPIDALEESDFSQPFFGRFFLNSSQSLAEEAVFHLKNPTQLEIHTHGGETVITAVEEILRKTFHATSQSWNDWISERYSAALPDSSNEEEISFQKQKTLALQKIPFAKTQRIAKILVDQYNGAWEREHNEIQNLLQNGNLDLAEERFKRLKKNKELGLRLLEPFRVVLYGPVNSGKSSLLNAMLGFSRVIVHSEPGTTRDTVGVESVVDGWPVMFFDTAGLRETEHRLELQGIIKTHEILQRADLVLQLVDLSSPPEKWCQPAKNKMTLTVLNKYDLPQVRERAEAFHCCGIDLLCVSAKTGIGIEQLLEKISMTLVPCPPHPGETVILFEQKQDERDSH